jgi:membrane fusion protein, copper/silver efflux system
MRAIAAFLTLAVTATAAYLAGSLHNVREPLTAAPAATPRVLYYVDPMHPAYTSDRPGTAPDCGMALEPVYADDSTAASSDAVARGGIAVSTWQQQLIGMQVATVEESSGDESLRLFGRVTPDETRVYKVNVGIDGFVHEVSGVTTGARVKQGQWLVTFTAPDSKIQLQQHLVALDVLDREQKKTESTPQQMALAKGSVQQTTDRLLALGMSPQQVDEIARTRLVPPNVRMSAPADGFVLQRSVSAGEKIERGQELYRIADLRRVWILLDVPTAEAARLVPGTTVAVRLAGRATSISARVSRDVLPLFEPATQSSKIRLEADNPGFVLRPDMFVDVDLRVPRPSGIVVPAAAVVMSGLRNTVFVERGAGVFEPREVETGSRFGDRVAIVRGLGPGDRIAVSGTFLLDSESRMKRHDQPHH